MNILLLYTTLVYIAIAIAQLPDAGHLPSWLLTYPPIFKEHGRHFGAMVDIKKEKVHNFSDFEKSTEHYLVRTDGLFQCYHYRKIVIL